MKLPAMTMRLRLAVAFALLFVATAGVLLTVNYGLVKGSLPRSDVEIHGQQNDISRIGPAGTNFGPPVYGQDPIRSGDLSDEHASDVITACLRGHAVIDSDRLEVCVDGTAIDVYTLAELPNQVRSDALDRLVRTSVLTLAITGVLALGLGWILAGRMLRPLQRITSTARRLSQHTLHERIGLRGPRDELKELADTFDSMLERLDRSFDAQRAFAANASHELRTPLAVIRTEVDVALQDPDATLADYRAAAVRIRQMTERSETLTDRLLTLARCENVLVADTPVNLAAHCEAVLEAEQARLDASHLLLTPVFSPAHMLGDPELLHHLVRNLVDNAIRYNVDGGSIDIELQAADGEVCLTIANSGPSIDGDLDRLFQPFVRVGTDRTGSDTGAGLGLSIVRSIAAAHGGTAQVLAREGGGLVVTVRLRGGAPRAHLTAAHPGVCER